MVVVRLLSVLGVAPREAASSRMAAGGSPIAIVAAVECHVTVCGRSVCWSASGKVVMLAVLLGSVLGLLGV
jgi:hypothetical protein